LQNNIQHEPKRKGHLTRYRQIVMVLAKYRLEKVLNYVGLQNYRLIGWIFRGNPWRKMTSSEPERMRMAIEELGTSFVKLGQILSTRTDLLPPAYTTELAKLQSSMKPMPIEQMKKVISNELGRPIDEIFISFENPIGIASIGQVYTCGQVNACTLADGTEVVTKVQKPGVPEQIEEDMEILSRAAVMATKHWKGAQQYDLVGIVREVSETIKNETDYIQEGHNAEYFAEFFQDDPTVHIPKIFWESTTTRVLTMERIHGIGILDVQALDKAGFDRKELAKRAVSLWLKMIFEGEAFHADPHPGNLFVESDGRLGLVDFGMVYTVDDEVRWRLATAVKAILDRNADTLIDALIELGAVRLRNEVSRSSLRKDLKSIMGHLPRTNLRKSSENVSSTLEQLLSVLRTNQIQLPSNTFMILKTIIMAQGLGRGLDPDFDILPMLESSVQELIKKKYSVKAALRRLPSAGAELVSLVGGLPQRLDRMMKTAERGEIQLRIDASGIEQHIHHLERLVNRVVIVIILAALVLGLALFFGLRTIH
jgi:ubiquinone biosynthesis protein